MAKKMIHPTKAIKKPNELSALTLAYIGDAIYEVYIRQHVILKDGRPNDYHRRTISFVSAKAQSKIVHHILPLLDEKEQDIVRRGRNAKSFTIPKNADVIDYRYSTAFEALIGFLFLSNLQNRLEEIIHLAINYVEGQDGEKNERK